MPYSDKKIYLHSRHPRSKNTLNKNAAEEKNEKVSHQELYGCQRSWKKFQLSEAIAK